jgi:hypothetical protein
MQNLLLKIPSKFKKSYGGTPEPQTTQDAPWLDGPYKQGCCGEAHLPREREAPAVQVVWDEAGRAQHRLQLA